MKDTPTHWAHYAYKQGIHHGFGEGEFGSREGAHNEHSGGNLPENTIYFVSGWWSVNPTLQRRKLLKSHDQEVLRNLPNVQPAQVSSNNMALTMRS